MERRLWKWAVVVLALGLVSSSLAAEKMLPDSVLQSFTDYGWTSNTYNGSTDIPGDPGTSLNVTLSLEGTWGDVKIGIDDASGLAPGDVWKLTVYNPDSYHTFIQPFLRLGDGWTYTTDEEGWVAADETKDFLFHIPLGMDIHSVGISIGTGDWTGRPSPSTFDVDIIPEPTGLLLVGLGGILLRRRRK